MGGFKSKCEALLFVLWFAGMTLTMLIGIAASGIGGNGPVTPTQAMLPILAPLCYIWVSTFLPAMNEDSYPASPRTLLGSVIVGLIVVCVGVQMLAPVGN